MKITFKTSALLAALTCSAKKDLRTYLQGVNIQIKRADVGMIYGTDGHILFAGQLPYETETPIEALNIIIPLETIKKVNKRAHVVALECINGEYFLDGIRFLPLDGTFPDVARVIPDIESNIEQKPDDFNPELLVRARDALSLYTGVKPKGGFSLIQRGNESAVMHAGRSDCLVVVMPLRSNFRESYAGFNRDFA
jgi:hypothetical protein